MHVGAMNRGRWKSLSQPKVIITIAAIGAIAVLARFFHLGEAFASALDRIRGLGALAPALFIVIYIAGAILFVPGAILTIGGGALFGLWWGVVYVSIGATIGATAAFVIGRYLARGWVRAQLKGNPRFAAIDDAVGREGWKIVALTRLSPVFPFNLLNYAFGLTGVSLRDYMIATWAGILPGTLLYVYIGSLGGTLARPGAAHRTAAQWTLDIVGLLATLAVALYAGRIAARALREKT